MIEEIGLYLIPFVGMIIIVFLSLIQIYRKIERLELIVLLNFYAIEVLAKKQGIDLDEEIRKLREKHQHKANGIGGLY